MEKKPMLVANIFTNPIGWAGTMVGTKLRYIITLLGLPVFTMSFLSNLTETSLLENWSSVLFICGFQLMFVHALRSLYTRVEELEESVG